MPLDSTNFHALGPVKSTDMRQFYDLFTGVMQDQPVTFRNGVNIGGNQGVASIPLKVYGATGQTTNLIDLYVDRTAIQPGFGFSALGAFAWGPGGAAAQDTFMSRIGTQAGHATDTPGLLIVPGLEVQGDIKVVGGDVIVEGGTVSGEFAVPDVLTVTQVNFKPTTGGTFIKAYSGDPSYVHMPKLTVTPGATALAGATINGNLSINGDVFASNKVQFPGGAVLMSNGGDRLRSINHMDIDYDLQVGRNAVTTGVQYAGRIVVNNYDVGWPLNVNGRGIASDRWFQKGDGGAWCWDSKDFTYGVGPTANTLVQRGGGGEIQCLGLYIPTGAQGGNPSYIMGQAGDGWARWWPASAIGPPVANVAPLTVLTATRGDKGPLAVTCNRTGYWVAYAFGGFNQNQSGVHYEGDVYMDDEPARMWRSHDGRCIIAIVWTTPRFRSAGQNINVNCTTGDNIGYSYGWTLYAVFVPTASYPA